MSAPSAAGLTKQRVGRYEIYAEISSGGMATVHLGRQLGHVGFSRTVAIKRLHPHVAREQEFVEMFLDEARLATRIQDPHVVPTLDVVADGGELMLVMEYVHGEALSMLLTAASRRKERVDPKVAVSIAAGMLDGLHAAHEAKNERGEPLQIVHRDVSPQNVLVGADGVTRVFDFGIAKAADRLHITQDGSLKGKVAYMSPEQLENEPIDRRSDIWAASVVLWEMLSGKRLFVADSQAALVRMILMKDVPKVSSTGAPAALDRILERGLAKNPRDRFATARDMALALEDALASAPARAVASWVERCASEPLAERAKLLGEVDRLASEDRPSGATRVEFKQILGAEMLADDDAPTTTSKNLFDTGEVTTIKPATVGTDESTLVLAPAATGALPAPASTVRIGDASALAASTPVVPSHAVGHDVVTRAKFVLPAPQIGPDDAERQQRSQMIAGVVILVALVFIVIGAYRLMTSPRSSAVAPASVETAPVETAPAETAPVTAAVEPPAPPPISPPSPVVAPQQEDPAAAEPPPAPPLPPASVIVGALPPSPPSSPPPSPPPAAGPQGGTRKPAGRPSPPAVGPAAPPSKKCTPLDFDYPACLKR